MRNIDEDCKPTPDEATRNVDPRELVRVPAEWTKDVFARRPPHRHEDGSASARP